jgi:curved DNA-binding protein
MDHYQTLGVGRNATADEIKQAYRRMAARHHPDRGGDTSAFQNIEQAYRVLSDPQARAQYDNPRPQFHGFESDFMTSGFDFDSIFNMFGAKFHHNIKPQARIQVWLELRDVITIKKQIIHVNTTQGQQAVEITVPTGVEDGDTVQYSGIAPGGLDLIVTFRIRPDARWTRRGNNLQTQCDVSIWELILGST